MKKTLEVIQKWQETSVVKKNALRCLSKKIEKKKSELAALEAQKEKLLHPVNMRTVMAKAKELGMTAEEVAEKLGIDVE